MWEIHRPAEAVSHIQDCWSAKSPLDDDGSAFAREATRVCRSPHQDRPPIQYALIIDAGSTGSRIHVYRFNYCNGQQPSLEGEIFEQTKPGLSAYAKDASKAAASLDELLRIALRSVPPSLHRCTPVTVKATAGLRMLGAEASLRILDAVESKLKFDYPFPIVKTDGVVVMDGRDEGVYAWITVNYLLGNIGGTKRLPTAAILDLGGGSTQIVFEPNFSTDKLNKELPPGEHRYDLHFSGHLYSLYQHSYDGYGLRAGRKKIVSAIKPDIVNATSAPCLIKGKEKKVLEDDGIALFSGSRVVGAADGYKSCSRFITDHLFDTSESSCKLEAPLRPCSFDGVYMPSLESTFAKNDMYAFSYFYDNFAEPFDKESSGFRVGDIKQAAETVCRNDKSKLSKDALEMLDDNPHWCIDLGFMHHLLATGYNLPDNRPMKTAKKINGIETGWALGAAIQILDDLMATGKDGACGPYK
eukprot:jgi/Hompol1/5890/HPOL_004771-RA